MLILTRRISEKIIIDTGREVIEVVPLSISGSQVKLGVQAPRNIEVHREEIYNRIKQEINDEH
jgi:carbon storage regulator